MRRTGDSSEAATQFWNTVGPGNGLYWPSAPPDAQIEESCPESVPVFTEKVAELTIVAVRSVVEIEPIEHEHVAYDEPEIQDQVSGPAATKRAVSLVLPTPKTLVEEIVSPNIINSMPDKKAASTDIIEAPNVSPLPERPITNNVTSDLGDANDKPDETTTNSEIIEDTSSMTVPAEKAAILDKKTDGTELEALQIKKAAKIKQTVKKATAIKIATKPEAATTDSKPVRPVKKKSSTSRPSQDEKEVHDILLDRQARRRIERANGRDDQMSDDELFMTQSYSPEPPKYVSLPLFNYFMVLTDKVPDNWTRRELSMAASVVKARPDKPPDEVVEERIKRVQNIPSFPTARSGPRYDP